MSKESRMAKPKFHSPTWGYIITAQAAGSTGRAKVALSMALIKKPGTRLDRGDSLVGNTGEMGKLTESQVSSGKPTRVGCAVLCLSWN